MIVRQEFGRVGGDVLRKYGFRGVASLLARDSLELGPATL